MIDVDASEQLHRRPVKGECDACGGIVGEMVRPVEVPVTKVGVSRELVRKSEGGGEIVIYRCVNLPRADVSAKWAIG